MKKMRFSNGEGWAGLREGGRGRGRGWGTVCRALEFQIGLKVAVHPKLRFHPFTAYGGIC